MDVILLKFAVAPKMLLGKRERRSTVPLRVLVDSRRDAGHFLVSGTVGEAFFGSEKRSVEEQGDREWKRMRDRWE